MISAYRSASGSGVRLDGGTAYAGAEISAHFDSLLVKVTCRGRDFTTAVRRARRALAEFRVRGVSTNIPFLMALLDEPDFREGRVTTSFIDEHPELLSARAPADRGTRLLSYLADVTVNQPNGPAPALVDPREKLPSGVDLAVAPPAGSRQRLGELGPEGFAAVAARPHRGGRHRHDLPRRPPVAAGHPGADPRPRRDRALRRADDAGAAVPRVLGRRDVRRGAALPRRGPVGAAGRGCARRSRTSACRCCCAGGTPSATRPTRPR